MEKHRPKGEPSGQPAPAEKKRELPFIPSYQGHRKTLRAPRPGELKAFPNPTSFLEHVEPAPEKPYTPMSPWFFVKALPVRGEPRPDLAPPSPLPPLRSRSRKAQRKTEQAATPQTAPAGEQPAVATPEQAVFDRIAELEARVAELEVKELRLAELEAKEARRREQNRDSMRRQRARDPEEARRRDREHQRAHRARRRQNAS